MIYIYLKSCIMGVLSAVLLETGFINNIYIPLNNYLLCLSGIISAVLVYIGIYDRKTKRIFLKLLILIIFFCISITALNLMQVEKYLYSLHTENFTEFSMGYSLACAAFSAANGIGALAGAFAAVLRRAVKTADAD